MLIRHWLAGTASVVAVSEGTAMQGMSSKMPNPDLRPAQCRVINGVHFIDQACNH
jgi:hypothetical protein